jgi:hypothetical protein
MKRWEHLIAADRRLDLADPKRAEKWLTSQGWWPKTPGSSEAYWTPKAQARWGENLRQLRVLAKGLKGARTRKAVGGTPVEDAALFHLALGALQEQLGMLRVVVLPVGKGWAAAVAPTNSNGMPLPDPQPFFFLDDLRVYWQAVFYSLVDGSNDPVCAVCGVSVRGLTPTGRPKRRTHCEKCRWKESWKKKAPEAKRAKWRADKKKMGL